MTTTHCVFCDIIHGRAPARIVRTWPDALAIRPLNPLTADHTLVIPRAHVPNAAENPDITAATMRRAAQLITPGTHTGINTGTEAGQTVLHLHIHLWSCSGLSQRCMPWEPWSSGGHTPYPDHIKETGEERLR